MNLPETLASELVRVAVVRARYERFASQPGFCLAPVMEMMSHSIERGIKAIGSGDAVEQMDCVKDLKGYSE